MLQLIAEFLGDILFEAKSKKARWLLLAAACVLLANSLALAFMLGFLFNQNWGALALTVLLFVLGIVVAAVLIVFAIGAELRADGAKSSAAAAPFSVVKWMAGVLLVLAVIPPPVVLVAMAILAAYQWKKRSSAGRVSPRR
jgi:hypothetical protein